MKEWGPALSKFVQRAVHRLRYAAAVVHPVRRVPYDPGAYPPGVNLIGYLTAQMGLGQGARLYARALEAGRIPHILLDTNVASPSHHDDTEFSGRLAERPVFATNLVHVNAEQLPRLAAALPAATWNRRRTIGVWLWELADFPREWTGAFRHVDEIWTPSHFTSNAVARISPVPVVTVPYGIVAEADPALGRTFFGLPEGAFLFLTLYDVRSYVERKNPYGAIDAFEKAFGTQHTDVLLVVKALNAGPGEMARLRRRIGSACNIRVLSATLEKRAVHSLIRACDALVSLHRSEGFGLVLAEAMSLGVPVIATGWSANTDFMDGGNSCPVSYHLVDTGGAYVPMRQRQQWADPDLADAAAQMRRLVLEPSFRRRIAQAGQDTIRLRFSVDASAAKMSARLHELGLLP